MVRKALLLAAFVAGIAVTGASAQDGKKLKGKLGKADKGKAFEKMDANGDGKVSKDEFKAGFEKLKEVLNEKGGEKAKKMIEKMDHVKSFEKIDTNKDGSISLEEYEKFEPLAEIKKKADK